MTTQIEGFDMYTYSDQLYSDFHKDAYGFRPQASDPFYTATPERKQVIWNLVAEQFEYKQNEEKLEDARSVAQFKDWVDSMIQNGAKDEETALRSIVEDRDFRNEMDVEHFVWEQGILFTDYGKQVCRTLCNML